MTAQLGDLVREVFAHPQAQVFPVVSGTAANSLALSALCPPWGSVLCHETAHIFTNEGGATSLFSGGAVMRGLSGADYKLHPANLQRAFDDTLWGDPHHSQPSVVSVTCPTDFGTVYSVDEVQALAAQARNLRMHLDGARLANALVALGAAPAALTCAAGVDAFSLGATKNGALSTDAIVCCDPLVADQLVFRLKRAGHVASKMRYQSAQLVAYLTDGLWLRLAQHSNDAMTALSAGMRGLPTCCSPVSAGRRPQRSPMPACCSTAWATASFDSSPASRPPTTTSPRCSAGPLPCSADAPTAQPRNRSAVRPRMTKLGS